jgi:hypothetical protein
MNRSHILVHCARSIFEHGGERLVAAGARLGGEAARQRDALLQRPERGPERPLHRLGLRLVDCGLGVRMTDAASPGSTAAGMVAIKAAGGVVIAQDEATADHFGMPQAALETGAVEYVLPLDQIGPALTELARKME